MPTIQETLFSTLNGATAAGSAVYPLRALDSQDAPYIVYSVVSADPETIISQNGAVLTNTRFQIDVFASTYASAQAISSQVQAAMAAASFQNVPLQRTEFDESEVALFRVSQDFSVWS